mmetsp:Transcript_50489/g.132775  ORF Transcript_50489/g.132775 Transcript_50489/m.132775 type:complete len:609 (+) Transcript_50489:33-1859(+)
MFGLRAPPLNFPQMHKPTFQLGPMACFCACDPAGRPRVSKTSFNDDEDEESFDSELVEQKTSLSSSVACAKVKQTTPLHSAGVQRELASPDSETSESTAVSTPPATAFAEPVSSWPRSKVGFFPNGNSLDFKLSAPPLGPVGSGGWHVEDDVTTDMRSVADRAEEMYRRRERKELTEFNRSFLTSITLSNYVDPIAPQHLYNALVARARRERMFTGTEPVYLGSSTRIIGWDGSGSAVLASEPCTMKKSLSYVMPQVEYLGWSAFDTNKPGAHGFSVIMDFGGGFDPLHFLNPKPVIDLASLVEGQWRRRLHVALLVDMPVSFRGILNTFLMFVKQSTREKIKMVPTMEDAVEELRKMGCDAETIANTKQFLAERRDRSAKQQFHPLVDYSFFREQLADLTLSEDTEYLTEEMHERLRDAIQEFRIHRWGLPSFATHGTATANDARADPENREQHIHQGKRVAFEHGEADKEEKDYSPLPQPIVSKRSLSSFALQVDMADEQPQADMPLAITTDAAIRPVLPGVDRRIVSSCSGDSGSGRGSRRPTANSVMEACGCRQGFRFAIQHIADCLRGALSCFGGSAGEPKMIAPVPTSAPAAASPSTRRRRN